MEQRNLILAIVLSIAIVMGFQYLTPSHPVPPPAAQGGTEAAPTPSGPSSSTQPLVPSQTAGQAPMRSIEAVLADSPRIPVDTPNVKGSINLKGARLDDLVLPAYHETTDPRSPAIVLLAPSGTEHSAIVGQGWIAKEAGTVLPDDDTLWRTQGTKLTIDSPLVLTWDNGAGLKFTRTISIDAAYMFTIKDTVANSGAAPVTLLPYALAARGGSLPVASTWLSYEGPIGVFGGVEEDIKYSKIDPGVPVERQSTGGWLGFSDKYWLTSIAPIDQTQSFKATFQHFGAGPTQKFQVDYLGTAKTVAPGASIEAGSYVFAGAKIVKQLAAYRDQLGLPHFDNAVDFGWFSFLTKPIFYLLDTIYGKVGNFGIAILMLTVVIKALFFPLANKAFVNMSKMKVLQPEMVKLREKFGDDKVRLQQETMALYKQVGANPVAGCLPILLQIPVFFSLYKVLYVTIEMRHAPFFGWIHDLSAPDPTTVFNLFGLIPWTPPHSMMIGVWPIIYGCTMFLQQRMQPQMADPVQAKMMQFMPIFFTFMLGKFPAGLMIYYSWNNVLTICQQWVITRRMSSAVPVKA